MSLCSIANSLQGSSTLQTLFGSWLDSACVWGKCVLTTKAVDSGFHSGGRSQSATMTWRRQYAIEMDESYGNSGKTFHERCFGQVSPAVCDLGSGWFERNWDIIKRNPDTGYFLSTYKSDCPEFKSILMNKTNQVVESIFKKMGISPPAVIVEEKSFFGLDTPTAAISLDKLTLSPHDIQALSGITSPFRTYPEAAGIVAHEAAHRVSRHSEKQIALAFERSGIYVASLEEAATAHRAFITLLTDKSLQAPSNGLVQAFAEKIRAIKADATWIEIGIHYLLKVGGANLNPKHDEVEADLRALETDPEYGRGLIQYLTRLKTDCWVSLGLCEQAEKDSLTHPSLSARIKYLTENLCALDQNIAHRDLCSIPAPANATTPRYDGRVSA